MSPEDKQIYQVEIPVQLDIESVVKRLQFGRGNSSRMETMAREMAETARSLARPRAVFQISRARAIDTTTVAIDGVRFTSKILARLLRDQDRVIPFIATVGKEMDEMPVPPRDMLRQFSLDAIKTVILVNAVDYLTDYVKEHCNIPRAALMNPGELADWPIGEQRPLFRLFGGAETAIGVSLTAGGAMKPIKSRSGIIFPNETGFVSCQLCTQFQCPGRHAEYDPALVKEYLGTSPETV
jgi:hypothetical protein